MVSPGLTWLSQSLWVLLLQALTCGLDPPSTQTLVVQRGRSEGGAAANLVRQVELLGQESQRARLTERRTEKRASERRQRLEVRAQEGSP